MAWLDPDWPEVTGEDMKRWGRQPVPDTQAARKVHRVGLIVAVLSLVIAIVAGILVAAILL